MNVYWEEVKELHEKYHSMPDDIKMEVDTKATFSDLFDKLSSTIDRLENLLHHFNNSDNNLKEEIIIFFKKLGCETSIFENVSYYENPFENRNWEYHNLGVPNHLNKIRLLLKQIEIKYYEEYLLLNADLNIKDKLEAIKKEFKIISQKIGYFD